MNIDFVLENSSNYINSLLSLILHSDSVCDIFRSMVEISNIYFCYIRLNF